MAVNSDMERAVEAVWKVVDGDTTWGADFQHTHSWDHYTLGFPSAADVDGDAELLNQHFAVELTPEQWVQVASQIDARMAAKSRKGRGL